jgi:hypothetical protein
MVTEISKSTKTFKLLTALQKGQTFTAKQAESRFGIKNVRAEATRLRQSGFAVYAEPLTTSKGMDITVYRLGNPSREIVALGYKAKSMGITL